MCGTVLGRGGTVLGRGGTPVRPGWRTARKWGCDGTGTGDCEPRIEG